jgi:hypothetical protein
MPRWSFGTPVLPLLTALIAAAAFLIFARFQSDRPIAKAAPAAISNPALKAVELPNQVAWTFKREITLGDLAQALALPAALFIAWLTTTLSIRQTRRLQTASEVVSIIKDLQARSERVSSAMEQQLTGRSVDGMKFREARVLITSERKRCESKLGALERMLRDESLQLRHGYQQWFKGLFEDGFATNARDARDPADPVVVRVQSSQTEWDQYLQQLKFDCLSTRVRFR